MESKQTFAFRKQISKNWRSRDLQKTGRFTPESPEIASSLTPTSPEFWRQNALSRLQNPIIGDLQKRIKTWPAKRGFVQICQISSFLETALSPKKFATSV
jgi:hypothetical protein